jgi:hypothetical protein
MIVNLEDIFQQSFSDLKFSQSGKQPDSTVTSIEEIE